LIPNAAHRTTEVVEMAALVRGIRPKPTADLVCGRCGKVAGLGREAGWVPVVPVGDGEPLSDGLCPDCVADGFTFNPSAE
jgi:hypothetical protein